LSRHQQKEAIQRFANGEAQADAARSFAVCHATISRWPAAISARHLRSRTGGQS
jgi:hypothetical protein